MQNVGNVLLFHRCQFQQNDGGSFGAPLVKQDGSIISWSGLHVGTERFTAWFERGRYSDSFAISLIC